MSNKARFETIYRRLIAVCKTSWRWPLLMAAGLCVLNLLLVVAIPAWIFTSRAIATEIAAIPIPLPPTASQNQTLLVKNIAFEPTLAGEQITIQFANRLPAGSVWGAYNNLPNDFQFGDKLPEQATLSFSGQVQKLSQPIIKTYQTPNLKQIYVENHLGKVQLFVKRQWPGSARLIWDETKNRIVIQVQNYTGQLLRSNQPYPGLKQREVLQQTAHGPVRLHILEMDPKHLEILPVLAHDKMGAKASVLEMVQENQGIAGVNASFFKQDSGIPLGTLILNEELVSGPLFERVCFGVDQANQAHLARISLEGSVTIPTVGATLLTAAQSTSLEIDNVNQPRTSATQTVLYTERWGAKAPTIPLGGIQVQIVDGHVKAVSSDEPLTIPKGGVVISGVMNQAMTYLATLSPDAQVQTAIFTKPDWSKIKHAISGGPYLVHQGERYIDLKAQQFRHGLGRLEPRTALGIKADGNILLVSVDGRIKTSTGLQLRELAQLMQELGAVEAMNLDGGSSTQMVVRGHALNQPGAAKVSTALVIRPITNIGIATR